MNQFVARPDNPFFNRQRIADPAYFRGRVQEIEALYSALITRQCRSIVGERKLGKSSLLTHLSYPETLLRHGLDPQQFAFIYVDLEGMASIRYEELWLEWLDLLANALPDIQTDLREMAGALAQGATVRFMQVRRLMRHIERAGVTVVIMLDEFESLAANPNFDPGFYGELRSLSGELGVVYLTASKRSLYDLTYQHADTLSSPFFNIFSEETLGLLPLDEAALLLLELSALAGEEPFSAEQIEYLIELAGPHPFFLQVAGSYLYAARVGGRVETVVPPQVVRRFKLEAEDHFRYWWQQLTSDEQVALLRLDRELPSPPMLRRLRERALIRPTNTKVWRPLGQALSDFLRRMETQPLEEASSGLRLVGSDTADLSGMSMGSYRLLAPVGRGGMAVVYKGYQATLDRYVAVKVMTHSVMEDLAFRERFQREAAAVGRLRHQNLVQMLDFGTHRDVSFMVMEYIDGQTLKERLAQLREAGERLPLREVVSITQGIAAALDYAHAHDIIHRDVKPSNIMLRSEERLARLTGAVPFTAVLTDFGVARMLEGLQLTEDGATIGTPDYMSPEQVQGEPALPASDIYSLAIVVYEMLTGELPFVAASPMAVLLKHLQSRPPLLTSKIPELPLGLEEVMLKALAKDPWERYPTAGQFGSALSKTMETVA